MPGKALWRQAHDDCGTLSLVLLEGWTIYQYAEDLPFIVRRHYGHGAGVVFEHLPIAFAKTLAEARDALPNGRRLVRVHRVPQDERTVVETWLTPSTLAFIQAKLSDP